MFKVFYQFVDFKFYPIASFKTLDDAYTFILKQVVVYGISIVMFKIKYLDFYIQFYKEE